MYISNIIELSVVQSAKHQVDRGPFGRQVLDPWAGEGKH